MSAPTRRQEAGFTLIDLLVAVALGLALTLAITLMLVRYESGRRSTTSMNDTTIGSAYVSYALDRLVRSAGSGYTQAWRNAFGCQVFASRSGTTTLPRATAFPAPFAAVPQAVRLAPVVIHAGAGTDGSDVLAIQTGSSGLGESPLPVMPGSAKAVNLRLSSTLGLRDSDLVMVFQDATVCMVQQVAAGFAGGTNQQLDFGGIYADDDINGVLLSSMGSPLSAWIAPLGNLNGNQPQFQLVGVGANATLVSHDMLQLGGNNNVVAIADGVADLRARYGVDTNNDNVIDDWRDPAVAPWNAATLLDGSGASRARLSQIVALRLAVLVRTQAPERNSPTAGQIPLFADLAASATRTLTAAEQQLRWRTVDFTIPLRNVLLAQRP
jgi:type IV pilus assembly protein PilW